MKNAAFFVKNIFHVITGKKTWVGYGGQALHQQQLPVIKPGVISPLDELNIASLNSQAIARINMLYAKDYSPLRDAELIMKCFRQLGS